MNGRVAPKLRSAGQTLPVQRTGTSATLEAECARLYAALVAARAAVQSFVITIGGGPRNGAESNHLSSLQAAAVQAKVAYDHCAWQVQAHSASLKSGIMPRSMPAGAAVAVTAFIGTDAGGNTANFDANGALIPGSVMKPDGATRIPDSELGAIQTMTPAANLTHALPKTGSSSASRSVTKTTSQITQQPPAPPAAAPMTLQQWLATPTAMYVGAGLLAVAAVGGIAYAMRPKGKKLSKSARANPSHGRRKARRARRHHAE